MSAMTILSLMKYWDLFIQVVTMIEQAVPDNTPGTVKLDMALKTLIRWNAELANFGPDLDKMVSFAKIVYTTLNAPKAA